jgi:AdoMet-dependent rRNA methyltransferase SPB1
LAALTLRYDQFQEKKAEMNAKFRAKRAREDVEEWDGLSDTKINVADASSEEDEDEDEEVNPVDSLLTSLGPRLDVRSKGQLSKRATFFFDRPDFDGIEGEEEDERVENGDAPTSIEQESDNNDSASENTFEIVRDEAPEPNTWDDSDDEKVPAQPRISHADPLTTRNRHRHCRSNDISPPNRNPSKKQILSHR